MSFPIGAKLGLLALGLLAISKSAGTETKKAVEKLSFKIFFNRILPLKKDLLTVIFTVKINNLFPPGISLSNAFLLFQVSLDKGLNWQNLGASNSKIPLVNIPAPPPGQPFTTYTLDLPIVIALREDAGSLLTKPYLYRLVFKYEIGGIAKQAALSYDFLETLKKVPGIHGVEGAQHANHQRARRALVQNIILQIRQIYPMSFSPEVNRPNPGKKYAGKPYANIPFSKIYKAYRPQVKPNPVRRYTAWDKRVQPSPDSIQAFRPPNRFMNLSAALI